MLPRNSLKELYALAALSKRQEVEAKKTIALTLASAGGSAESVRNALQDYLETHLPALAEARDEFIEVAKRYLDQEAGRVQNLAEYTVLKTT